MRPYRTLTATVTVLLLTMGLAAASPRAPVPSEVRLAAGGACGDPLAGLVTESCVAWIHRFDDGAAESASASATGAGLVRVAGSRCEGNDCDALLVALTESNGSRLWTRTLDLGGSDSFAAIVARDGDTYAAGSACVFAQQLDCDIVVVAHDAEGEERWRARYVGPAGGDDRPTDVALSADGGAVIVSGFSSGGPSAEYDAVTLAYDADTGGTLWTDRYNGPASSRDRAGAVAVDPAGGVFVTGPSHGAETGLDYLTASLDGATGGRRWRARYAGPAVTEPDPAVLLPDTYDSSFDVDVAGGLVFVTGISASDRTGLDYATVAYDAGTGARRWEARFNGYQNREDQAYRVTAVADGSVVFVTGSSLGAEGVLDVASGDYRTGLNVVTIAYDGATGRERWRGRYAGPGSGWDVPTAMALSKDERILYVTASSPETSGGDDIATLAYDTSTGDELWIERYAGEAGGADRPSSVALGGDGVTVLVSGTSRGSSGNDDIVTIAYRHQEGAGASSEAFGERAAKRASPGAPAAVVPCVPLGTDRCETWGARHAGPGSSPDTAADVAVSSSGDRVYVAGTEGEYAEADLVAVAYDAATGETRWTARYRGPEGEDGGTAVAVARGGALVVVAGRSAGAGSDLDAVMVGYDAATGAERWTRRYDGPGSDRDVPVALAPSPDGETVYAGVRSVGEGTALDYTILALDAATGAVTWIFRYDGLGHRDDVLRSMVLAPDGGRVFLTGDSVGDDQRRLDVGYATVAVDTAPGEVEDRLLWATRYESSFGLAGAKAVAVAPDGGGVFVTGWSMTPSGAGNDAVTIGYDAGTGDERWRVAYDAPNGSPDLLEFLGGDVGWDVAVSPDSARVYVTGQSRNNEDFLDYLVVAYDAASGEERWIDRYSGTGVLVDVGTAIVAGPDDRVYVTGASVGLTYRTHARTVWRHDYDYATVAFEGATGRRLWVGRYNGPPVNAEDVPLAMALAPAGTRVFVTGRSSGTGVDPLRGQPLEGGTGQDATTLAYPG